METERRLMGEETPVYTDVSYTTTEMSPYSTTSSTSADSSHNSSYYSEFDWHQGADRMYYPLQDRMDISMHNIYPGYQQVASSDVYQPNALWHPQPVEMASQITPVTSILPSMNFSRSSDENSVSPTGSNGKPKRRRVQTQPQRKAANVRERKRMFHLNEAFDSLRLRLPAFNYEKRLSRIETLRLAITYIGFMKDVTDGKDPKEIKLAKNIHMDDFEMTENGSPSSSKDAGSDSE